MCWVFLVAPWTRWGVKACRLSEWAQKIRVWPILRWERDTSSGLDYLMEDEQGTRIRFIGKCLLGGWFYKNYSTIERWENGIDFLYRRQINECCQLFLWMSLLTLAPSTSVRTVLNNPLIPTKHTDLLCPSFPNLRGTRTDNGAWKNFKLFYMYRSSLVSKNAELRTFISTPYYDLEKLWALLYRVCLWLGKFPSSAI